MTAETIQADTIKAGTIKAAQLQEVPLRVYLASPFFNEEEIERVAFVEKVLRDKGLDVFSPREHQNEHLEFGSVEWRKATFENDVEQIVACDVVVAVHSLDSGTNWELGAAAVLGRPVILFDDETDLPKNIMLTESAYAFLETRKALEEYDFHARPLQPIYYEGEVI